MKAKRVIEKLLETDDLDFDPAKYIQATLMPQQKQLYATLRGLGFNPVEKRRVRTMWEKTYPAHRSHLHYRIDIEMEFEEGEDRFPFWVSLLNEENQHVSNMTKYILTSRTLDIVLRRVDAFFTSHSQTLNPFELLHFVENTMNYVRNTYRPGAPTP